MLNKKTENAGERPRIKPPEIRPRTQVAPAAPAGSPDPKGPRPGGPRPMGPSGPRPSGPRPPRFGGGGGGNRRPRLGEPGSGPAGVGAERARISKFGTGNMPMPTMNTNEKSNPEAVRFVPLGGLEEVGRNCMFLEYKNEIVLIDVGLQFPEDETPGIDYIIPNTQYLEKKRENVRAIILTHGHYDHIGALPHLLQ